MSSKPHSKHRSKHHSKEQVQPTETPVSPPPVKQPVAPSPQPTIQPAASKPVQQLSDPSLFAIKEDSNYSQMKNNIITQSTRICEIVSDAGKFGAFYDELTNNIVSSMNDMIDLYVKNGKKTILIDIYDALVNDTNWDALKDKFKVDMATKGGLPIPKYTTISTNLKRFKIDKYDTDILVDMYSNMDEETVKHFAKSQEDAVNELYSIIDEVTNFETSLCAYRAATIATMKENINTLYALHVNYAKAILNKDPKTPSTISINGKAITFQKGQKPFICDALKKILLE